VGVHTRGLGLIPSTSKNKSVFAGRGGAHLQSQLIGRKRQDDRGRSLPGKSTSPYVKNKLKQEGLEFNSQCCQITQKLRKKFGVL
jgi:hypothetical protein